MSDDNGLNQGDIDKIMNDDNGLTDDWDDSSDEGTPLPTDQPTKQEPAQAHSFGSLKEQPQEGERQKHQLEFILDIPLEITVELGRTKMPINDLLQLGQGSVIELDKLAGEPLEILINSKLVARGEVVVVNEKFGVRLTDIVSPMERVQSLA